MPLLKPALIIVIFTSCLTINAQDLILVKGNRTKEVKVGKVISIQTSNSEGTLDKWNFASAQGKLTCVEGDSISLKLFTETDLISDGRKLRESKLTRYRIDSTQLRKSFAKSDIRGLSVWGNKEEAIMNRKIWGGVGGIVISVGFLTALFGTSEDEDTPQDVKIAAVSMALIGCATIMIAQPNNLITSNDLRKNKKRKYWKIQ